MKHNCKCNKFHVELRIDNNIYMGLYLWKQNMVGWFFKYFTWQQKNISWILENRKIKEKESQRHWQTLIPKSMAAVES